jgi:hypothetical protein
MRSLRSLQKIYRFDGSAGLRGFRWSTLFFLFSFCLNWALNCTRTRVLRTTQDFFLSQQEQY